MKTANKRRQVLKYDNEYRVNEARTTTKGRMAMTAAAWVTSGAAAIQAIAVCVLVGVTIVYVRHTKTLAEVAQRQAERERRHRQEFAIMAIRYELLDIIRCCFEGRQATPIRLSTHSCDSLKGDFAVLGLDVMAELAILYAAVRECNSQYDQFISKDNWLASAPFYSPWNELKERVLPQAKKLGVQIAELDVSKVLDRTGPALKARATA
jgi:hypothetical protein